MTYYAQMARSYAIVTMFATIATYLLLRAYPDGRWRWWAAYGAAVALTGLFNLFGLLILVAHGVTLLLTDARGQSAAGRRIGRIPLRWLAASAAAVIVLGPLLSVAHREQKQIAWVTRPDAGTIEKLIIDFAGSRELVLPVALLALAGIAVACLADDWRPLNPAAVALPWLAVPPFVLIAVSYLKPVYVERYVEFCLPALAICVGAGLAGLVRLAAGTRLARRRLAWVPAAVVIVGLGALLIGPQQAIRQTAARPDNLRLASAIVAAHEQPGNVVFYLPVDMHVLGTGYPAPFLRLRDIALARVPDRLRHLDRHRDHQSRAAEEPVHRRQAGVGSHRRQQLQVPRPGHAGGQGEDGPAGRRGHAHHRPLAGGRGHAHPVRVLTALGRRRPDADPGGPARARRGLRRRVPPRAGCRIRWPATARGSCGGHGAAATSRFRPACP